MSVERQVIAAVLRDRKLAPVTDAGVTPGYFRDPEDRQVYQSIIDHHTRYSEIPSMDTFRKDWPAYKLPEVEDKIEVFLDEIKADYEHFLIEDGLTEALNRFDLGDVEGTRQSFQETLTRMAREIRTAREIDLTKTGDARLKRYESYRKRDRSLLGVPTGFGFLDRAVQGWQKKQLITFAGPPKAGKSTMMLLSAMAAHAEYYEPLFIGFEMSNEEQEERHDAIKAQIAYQKLRKGALTKEEMLRLERMTHRLEDMPTFILTEDADSTMSVTGVASLIEKNKPDVVFVDGVYMMEDDRGERKGSPAAITNITRDFKQLARNRDIPIVISTQVLIWKMDRKHGVTANSIGYASSFNQDSDVVCSVEKTEDFNTNLIKILLGRNTPYVEQPVRWDWDIAKFEEMEPVGGEYGDDPDGEAQPHF